jgi:branched-chain amino acid transport system substrate-binding protein
VTNAGAYTFRVCPSDLAHGAALARYAREQLGLDRGAILYLNDDYGRGIRRTFTSEFTQRGGTVVESDPYLGSTPNVDAYLDRIILRKRSQFVLVAGNRSEAEEALSSPEARTQGSFMGGDGLAVSKKRARWRKHLRLRRVSSGVNISRITSSPCLTGASIPTRAC